MQSVHRDIRVHMERVSDETTEKLRAILFSKHNEISLQKKKKKEFDDKK